MPARPRRIDRAAQGNRIIININESFVVGLSACDGANASPPPPSLNTATNTGPEPARPVYVPDCAPTTCTATCTGAGSCSRASPGPAACSSASSGAGGCARAHSCSCTAASRCRATQGEPAPQPQPKQKRAAACLELAAASETSYSVANQRCSGRTVLAVIERQEASGATVCKSFAIRDKLVLPTAPGRRPQINFQCILQEEGCSKEAVGGHFS